MSRSALTDVVVRRIRSDRHTTDPHGTRGGVRVPRLRFLFLLVITSLSLTLPVLSQPGPRELPVAGATWLGVETVRGLIRGVPIDSVAAVLQKRYAADGFLDARVDVDSVSGLRIEEGPRFHIERVVLVPDSLRDRLRSVGYDPGELEGAFFVPADIESSVGALLRGMGDLGYPLATAIVDPAIVDSAASVRLEIRVHRGDRVVISAIDVQGVESGRDLIVLASGVRPGDLFTEDLASEAQSRIRRLNLFGSVDEPRLYRIDSQRYGLLITVSPGNPNTFDGVIGFQPADKPDERGTVTGLINILLRNFFGVGRKLSARLNIPNRETQEIELRYGEPYLFRLPIDLEVGYRQIQEAETSIRTSYVQRFFTADAFYNFAGAWSIRVGGSLEATLPVVDSTGDCFRQVLNSSTLSSTVGIVYDGRSNPLNPITGVRYSTTYSYGNKELRGPVACLDSATPTSDGRQRIELDLETYLPLFGSVVLADGLHFGQVSGNLLDENDLFYFGGQSTVRGLRENLIRASRRFWGTVETRLLLAENSYAAAFFDGGFYAVPELRGIAASEAWTYGYGVGAQIETPLGLARISFALGRGDSFDTGKVFIGLINQF